MLFNSLIFLYCFLPITYFVFWRLKTKNQRYVWLTITGYVFYGFWNWKFCFLMLLSTTVSFFAGLGIAKFQENPHKRKLCLVAPIVFDLCLLGFFKYTNFIFSGVTDLVGLFGGHFTLPHLNIILPIGISFYTFHTITYIVDSYRKTITPTRNFFEFSCYVSLFSQLVAGPIVRFREVEADLENINHANSKSYLEEGLSFFCIGLAKKVLLADTIAMVINPGFSNIAKLSTGAAWLCALGYTYQLYFDFSGYSDMAVGLGQLFGIRIPQNFNSPYKALNPSDFWRRWHISLSSCLRDYLYISLGGNRTVPWKIQRNILFTMLIGGIWHGANWTFFIWGLYHGLLIVFYQQARKFWDAMPSLLQRGATFFLALVGWVIFRADSVSDATLFLKRMFTIDAGENFLLVGTPVLLFTIIFCAILAHFCKNTFELKHHWGRAATLGFVTVFIFCMVVIAGGTSSPFLYFQF